MLWAVVTLRMPPREQLLVLLERRAEELSGDFSAQSLACTLAALATLGKPPGECLMLLFHRSLSLQACVSVCVSLRLQHISLMLLFQSSLSLSLSTSMCPCLSLSQPAAST
jgi:hypothetical protein